MNISGSCHIGLEALEYLSIWALGCQKAARDLFRKISVNTAKDIFQRAEQAARKGNLEYSIELYLQGLTIAPKAAEERQTLHRIEAQMVENNGGNPAGGVATKIKTKVSHAKVKQLKLQKKWDEAVMALERTIMPQPHNTQLLFELAELLEKIEAPQSAVAILGDITDIDKTHVESYRRLGTLLAEQGDPRKAIEAWEKLKMYRPEDKEAGKAVRDLSAATWSMQSKKRSLKPAMIHFGQC